MVANSNELNETFSLRDKGSSNADHTIDQPRHRWYFVKEAFSPVLVNEAINDSATRIGDLVIDPFCGSGTVLLASAIKGIKSIAIEVNPFLAFVAETKLRSVRPRVFSHVTRLALDGAMRGGVSPLETFSSFEPDSTSGKWLFNRDVLRAMRGAWEAMATCDAPARYIVRLALLGAAMDNCNATRDGKCLRYRTNWQERHFDRKDFVQAFMARIAVMRLDMKTVPVDAHKATIITGDSRSVLASLPDIEFKVCVTSPPYLNSFDYSDIYRPELFLGEFVTTNDDLRAIRLRTMRSHVQVAWDPPTHSNFGALFGETVNRIQARSDALWNKRLPMMIQAYFEDIERVLTELRAKARTDASVWLVVSTSAYAGVEIPVDLIIGNMATQTGWYLREIGVLRHLRTAGQHWSRWGGPRDQKPRLRESVVILDASPNRRRTMALGGYGRMEQEELLVHSKGDHTP